jgi:hypothetical protein
MADFTLEGHEQPETGEAATFNDKLRVIVESANGVREAQSKYHSDVSDLMMSLWKLSADTVLTITLHDSGWRKSSTANNLSDFMDHYEAGETIEDEASQTTTYKFKRGNIEFVERYDDERFAYLGLHIPSNEEPRSIETESVKFACLIPLTAPGIDLAAEF